MIAVVASMMPAGAKSKTLTFEAQIPCAAICSYWLDGDAAACSAPGPEGSFADVTFVAPRGIKGVSITAEPLVDWDLFLCSMSGKLMAYSYEMAFGAEEIFRQVKPGRRYIVRAYNFSDIEPVLEAQLTFIR